ncbi:hypothetical protein ABI59_07060 [Acidobacteria bacterium Mor1]|nr:hypothetical protein ABI59_07060 [Acidobacteria bacterium Mor1]
MSQRTLRSALVLLALGVAFLPALAEEMPTAEQIIDRSVEATGGKAAYEKLKNRMIKATFSLPAQGITGAATIYETDDNRNYTVIEIPQLGKIEQGSDGDVMWENTPFSGPSIVEGSMLEQRKRESMFNWELNWKEHYPSAETVGKVDVKGKPAWEVKLTPESGSPVSRFYDVESGMLVKSSAVMETPMGEMPSISYFEDVRELNGRKVPFKVVQEAAGMQQVLVLEEVQENIEIDEATFKLPEAIKSLVEASAAAPTE